MAERLLAQLQTRLDPDVVGLTPRLHLVMIKIQRPHGKPAVDLHAFIEPVENSRLRQLVVPIGLQSAYESFLLVVILRKRTTDAGNPHKCSSSGNRPCGGHQTLKRTPRQTSSQALEFGPELTDESLQRPNACSSVPATSAPFGASTDIMVIRPPFPAAGISR